MTSSAPGPAGPSRGRPAELILSRSHRSSPTTATTTTTTTPSTTISLRISSSTQRPSFTVSGADTRHGDTATLAPSVGNFLHPIYQFFEEIEGGCPVFGEGGRADGFVDEADVAELLRVGRFDLHQRP